MTLDEKTVQLATLYGYRRVLADYLPTEAWRSALWKDGVANIDEHLNGYPYNGQDLPGAAFLWPASKHTLESGDEARCRARYFRCADRVVFRGYPPQRRI